MLSALTSWAYGTPAAPQADGEATIPAVKTESEAAKSDAKKTEVVKTETPVNKPAPQIGKRVSQMFKRGSHAPKSTEPVPPLPQPSKVEAKEAEPPVAKPEPQITKRVSQMLKKVVPASKPTPQVPVPAVPEGSKTPSRPLLQTSKTAPEPGKTANKSPSKSTKALPPSKILPTAPLPAAPSNKDEDKKALSPPTTPEPPKPGKLSRLKSVPNLFKVSLTDLAPSHGLDHHPKLSEVTASPAISTKSTFQDADTPPASAMPNLRHVLSRKFTRPSLKTNGEAASTPAVPTVPTDKKDGGSGGTNRKGMWKKMASMGDLRSRYGAVPSGMVVAA